MSEKTYNQKKNRNVILNRAKDCYKTDKERLRNNGRDKYRDLSELKRENMEEICIIICLKKRSKI